MGNASSTCFADYLMMAQDSQNIEYDDFKVIDKDVTRVYFEKNRINVNNYFYREERIEIQ